MSRVPELAVACDRILRRLAALVCPDRRRRGTAEWNEAVEEAARVADEMHLDAIASRIRGKRR